MKTSKTISAPSSAPALSPQDLEAEIERARRELARRGPTGTALLVSRGKWRNYSHVKLIADRLADVASGKIRRLVVSLPPQHGKSSLISYYFPIWYLGTNPDRRIILASYEAEFAAQWGRRVRDGLQEWGPRVWGVDVRRDSSAADRWDIAGRLGGMVTAGVGGPMTGKTANCLLIDDPLKNAEEAASEVIREKMWEWYLSTALTRVSEDGFVVVIMTRWHQDDLVGRLLSSQKAGGGEKWEYLRLPALAETPRPTEAGEPGFGPDPLGRVEGAALCPEMFTLETLTARKAALGDYLFAGLYQQRPFAREGGMFNVEVLRAHKVPAPPPDPKAAVRGWDLAATEKRDSKQTAGVRMTRTPDGRVYVEHVVAGKWAPDRRNAAMLATSRADRRRGTPGRILFEHEGGSSGEDQALAIVRLLAGMPAEAVKVSGDKVARADAFAALCNAGGVWVVDDGSWDVEGYLGELEAFPNGTLKDRVDASSLAFNKLILTAAPGGYGAGPPPEGWRAGLEKLTRPGPDDGRPPRPEAEPADVTPREGADWRGDWDRLAGGA